MSKALAMRIQRRKKIGAKNSPLIYPKITYFKGKPFHQEAFIVNFAHY